MCAARDERLWRGRKFHETYAGPRYKLKKDRVEPRYRLVPLKFGGLLPVGAHLAA
jgi:hypothetical protein